MHTLSLGTALLDELAAAVQAVKDRLQIELNREEAHAPESYLGESQCIRCLSARCFLTGSPPLFMQCGIGSMCRLTLGTALLDQLAVAVRAEQDRLQLEPDREEARAQGLNLGRIMMHTLTLGTVPPTGSPPLFMSAGSAPVRT